MGKEMGKEKKGIFQLAEGDFGPARRGARTREGAGPAVAQGRGRRRGRAGATASLRAHTSARAEGGGQRHGLTARANRPSAGKKTWPPVGSTVIRRRWPGSWSTGRCGLARAGAGDPRGRLNLARGGREGAVHGEVAELRGVDRRQWSLGEGLGRGSGALSSRHCEEVARLT
jgi:hypothetical protein